MDNNPTVFIVDDDVTLLKSLRWLLESADLRVETYESAQRYLDTYDPSRPGCLILDVRMPGMDGLELQKALNFRHARIPTIFMTGHGDIAMAVKCLNEGAFDFLEKPYSDEDLIRRIHAALHKDSELRKKQSHCMEAAARIAQLTAREREVMDMLVSGLSNKQIAVDLGISEKTVAVHRSNMMDKLQATSVVDVIQLAAASKAS